MNIIVGGAGFIGSRLCAQLKERGDDFYIVDKVMSESFPEKTRISDVTDLNALLKVVPDNESDTIVNLAAEHRDDVRPLSLYDDVNVGGARNICALAEARGINKIVFTSTVAVYGFAPLGTSESGKIDPFNDYGRTKYEAECIYREWQAKDPQNRVLAVLRPTVVFGERNRGNVYNLLRQIASGKFVMIGRGVNRKSMAYVENVAAFIRYASGFNAGVHIYNYIDKPDYTMNQLVLACNKNLGLKDRIGLRIPYVVGVCIGKIIDCFAFVTRRKFAISAIRVKKFCADSVYSTKIDELDFERPVSIDSALLRTLKYEFLEDNSSESVFYTE